MAAVLANKQTVETQISSVLAGTAASAEASLAEAQVELDKTTVHAGVDGTLEQFTLRKGDVVNPHDAAGRRADSRQGRQTGLSLPASTRSRRRLCALAWWRRLPAYRSR